MKSVKARVSARVLDLLLPGRDFREVARKLAARAPEIDLKSRRRPVTRVFVTSH